MKIHKILTPNVPKRMLLFIAAMAWTAAGGILLTRGILMVVYNPVHDIYILGGSIMGGVLFYVLMFSRISRKHTERILQMKIDKPSVFSFFNIRSYILMTVMISGGITLRLSGLASPVVLCMIYITMGIPLFMSAFRFYYNGLFYNKKKAVSLNTAFFETITFDLFSLTL